MALIREPPGARQSTCFLCHAEFSAFSEEGKINPRSNKSTRQEQNVLFKLLLSINLSYTQKYHNIFGVILHAENSQKG